MKIAIIAGEESGDQLGGALMQALGDGITYIGVGGRFMQNEGLESLFPMEELSLMGLMEVLPKAPHLLARLKQLAAYIASEKPDILISIDAPDFCFRLASRLQGLRGQGCRFIHYVAPSVWAWRPERAKKVAALYDDILCLFPFEPRYFEAEGMRAHFVGHPVLQAAKDASGKVFRTANNISLTRPICGLFLGSRTQELKFNAETILSTARSISNETPDTLFLLPTTAHLRPAVDEFMNRFEPDHFVTHDATQKWNAFAACDHAIAVSGTVGLELAVLGIPHIIGYRMNRMTYQVARRLVKLSHIHLANIIQDFDPDQTDPFFVPELVQEGFTVKSAFSAINLLDKNDFSALSFYLNDALDPKMTLNRIILNSI